MSQFEYTLIFFFICPALSLIINNCFTSPNTYLYIPYTVTTSNTYVNLNFTLTPTFTAALALLQTSNVPPSLNRQDWIHMNPFATSSFDYEGMNTGRIQYAYVLNPGLGSTLHIYLLSLQRSISGCYSLRVSESNTVGMQCSTLNFYASTKYCASCPSIGAGVYCSMVYHTMTQGDIYTVSLSPISYTPLRMKSGIKGGVSVESPGGGVSVYFQFDKQSNQFAGLVNYLPSAKGQGRYTFSSGQTYTSLFSGGNEDLLLGLFNNNTFPVTITVSYVEQEGNNTMLILIGVLSGFLFIGVIIATIAIVKRIRQNRATITSELVLRNQVQNNQKPRNKMSVDEIDFYFPTILRSRVFPDQNKPVHNKDQPNQYECIICLCNVQSQDPIKVGYCKHFFHAKCLTEWFKKQQSCPYCRKDYSKPATLQLYKELVREGNKEVKGEELVLTLFRAKMNATMETLQIEDIQNMSIQH